MDEQIKTICGDAIDEMKKIPDKSIHLIVTDPPYNLNKDYGNNQDKLEFEEYLNFSRQWLTEANRILKDNGTIYVFMGMRYISYIYVILEQELGMFFNSWITWFYTQGIGKTKGYSPRHDDILMFTKNKKILFLTLMILEYRKSFIVLLIICEGQIQVMCGDFLMFIIAIRIGKNIRHKNQRRYLNA